MNRKVKGQHTETATRQTLIFSRSAVQGCEEFVRCSNAAGYTAAPRIRNENSRGRRMGLPPRVTPLSAAEYLRVERAAELRHEYFDGEMFAMSGGSAKHSLIKMNVGRELSTKLKGRPCTAFDSDLRIQIPPASICRALMSRCHWPRCTTA